MFLVPCIMQHNVDARKHVKRTLTHVLCTFNVYCIFCCAVKSLYYDLLIVGVKGQPYSADRANNPR